MAHNFSERLLLRPISKKDITQSQEGWAKRDGSKPQTAKSKFYTAPSTVPFPKKEKSIKKSSNDYSNEMYALHILKIVRLKTDRQIDSMWK